jgi:hypothetical protein
MHAYESLSLAYAATLVYVLQDRDDFLCWQLRSKEGSPLAFGKSVLANVAVKEAVLLSFTVAVADREISPAADAVFGAQAGFWQQKRDRSSRSEIDRPY